MHNLLKNARELRKNSIMAEKKLWQYLRLKQFKNIRFRRQVILLDKYIVDFLSYKPKIIIELDGGQHNYKDVKIKDEIRTQNLQKLGFKVVKIWNDDVINNIEGVLLHLDNQITSLP